MGTPTQQHHTERYALTRSNEHNEHTWHTRVNRNTSRNSSCHTFATVFHWSVDIHRPTQRIRKFFVRWLLPQASCLFVVVVCCSALRGIRTPKWFPLFSITGIHAYHTHLVGTPVTPPSRTRSLRGTPLTRHGKLLVVLRPLAPSPSLPGCFLRGLFCLRFGGPC